MLPAGEDPIRPAATTPLAITLDGERLEGIAGQSIAGVILASGRLGFRRTSSAGRPRGIFCGIGVCFDCIVEVDGARDVRACQRRAVDGNVVITQHDALPALPRSEPGASQPGASEPGASQPGAPEPGASDPGSSKHSASKYEAPPQLPSPGLDGRDD